MKQTLILPKLPIKRNEVQKIIQNIIDNNNILPNISNPKLIINK